MSDHIVAATHEEDGKGNFRTYVVGFVLSVLLTLGSYFIVTRGILNGQAALMTIGGLAALQFMVQLFCFLHLGGERKPRWKLLVFWSMIAAVFIIVVGSIWVMDNLNYNMGSGAQMDSSLRKSEGI